MRFLMPCCADVGGIRSPFRVRGFIHRVHSNSCGSFFRHLRDFFTSAACRVVHRRRLRCRGMLFVVFGLMNFCIGIRCRADENHVSLILRASGFVCVVRFGLGKATRRTLRRVGSGRCTLPFRASKQELFGVKIGFDTRAQGVRG